MRSVPDYKSRRHAFANRAFDLAALETRVMYCVDHGLAANLPAEIGSYPAVFGPVYSTSVGVAVGPTASTLPVAGAIPGYSSNPNATVKLYLDFDGAAATTWGSYSVPATPAYDTDGNAGAFSDTEQAAIREMWARVAEKYSPFNLDVTTIDPGTYPLGKVLRVVVGGAGAWSGGLYGGLSYVGSFTGGPNTSWVFPQNLAGGNPVSTAEAIAHESGHGFGLEHQSTFDAAGNKIAEYNSGDSLRAPIMGNSYHTGRGLWWYGTNTYGAKSFQDDMAVISSTSNGFGYRADDHGNSAGAADALLTAAGNAVSGSGVIEKMSDADFFKFMTGGGTVTLNANVIAAGATLDLKLALYASSGALVATADTASYGESLTLDLAPGSYYLAVMSEGNYGDVGQYTLTGNVPAPVGVLTAPSGLTASTAGGQTSLAWLDNSADETGFLVQRSDDGGVTWIDVARVGADTTGYQEAAPTAGAQHQYRVSAYNASMPSDFSNVVAVWGAPDAPTSVTATAASGTQVAVTWTSVNGASTYLLQRSTDGITWMQVASTGGGTTAYQDGGLTSGKAYYYRVYAANAGGTSGFSPVATVTTPFQSVPTAPSNLVAVQQASNKVRLTWTDRSTDETGFRIEYSTNGTTWTVLTTVGANATTYTASGLRKNTAYLFRVSAYNAVGSSAYTAPAQAAPAKGTTLVMAPSGVNGQSTFSAHRLTLDSVLAVGGNDLLTTRRNGAKIGVL